MERIKTCCGLSAVMVQPLYPMCRDVEINGHVFKNVKFYTAIYECKRCGSISVRGETNQLREWNTFIQWIKKEDVPKLIKEKETYEMDRRPHEEMPST
jgi:hypothetical protein